VRLPELQTSATRSLLTLVLIFVLLVVGWFVLEVGAGACDENLRAGTPRAEVCRVVEPTDATAPTVWLMVVAPLILAAIGFTGRSTRILLVAAACLILLQLTTILVTLIVAA
jgi:hypothetical protein